MSSDKQALSSQDNEEYASAYLAALDEAGDRVREYGRAVAEGRTSDQTRLGMSIAKDLATQATDKSAQGVS